MRRGPRGEDIFYLDLHIWQHFENQLEKIDDSFTPFSFAESVYGIVANESWLCYQKQ